MLPANALPTSVYLNGRFRQRTRRRTAGVTLLEAALSLAIMAVVSAGLVALQAQSAARTKDNATADRTAAIVQATSTYIQQNFTQIVSAYAAPGLAIPVYAASGAAPPGLTSIQASGLLPSGWTTTNPYGQAEWLLVLQTTATPTFDFMIVTQGGRMIPAGELPYVAAKVGAAGGFVSSQAPYSAANIEGAYGGWSYLASKWNIGGHAPSDGHLAAVLSYGQTPLAQYLYRVSVPGHPEANQMSTALDMNGNDVDNANSVNAVNVNATDMTAAGNVTATGNVSAATVVASGNVQVGGNILTPNDVAMVNTLYGNGTSGSYGENLTVSKNLTVSGTTAMTGLATANKGVALGAVAVAGGACSPNGTIATDSSSNLLVCQSGAWAYVCGGIGCGQAWVNETANRTMNTTYTNSTSRPMQVAIAISDVDGTSTVLSIDGTDVGHTQNSYSAGNAVTHFAIIPIGATYIVKSYGSGTYIINWSELR
jgi:hypothetical protein